MNKNDKIDVVLKAYEEVRAELGADVYMMIGVNQRLQKIQEKLPTKPMYSTAKIQQILTGKDAK